MRFPAPKASEPAVDHRWSELIPPHTALTFAAMWDPVDGMVTFSGARLLDPNKDRNAAPPLPERDSPDDVRESQALTLDRLACAPSSGPPDSFAYACDAIVDADSVSQDARSLASGQLLCVPAPCHPPQYSPAAASSAALASLVNVSATLLEPSRPSQPSACERQAQHNTCERQAQQTACATPSRPARPPRPLYPPPAHYQDRYHAYLASCGLSDASITDEITDEGFFEDRRFTSRFSVTTTSTSRYIEVPRPSTAAGRTIPRDSMHTGLSAWSTLRDAERAICFNVPLECGRKLRKGRPARLPLAQPQRTPSPASDASAASPAEVLARAHYNHVSIDGPPKPQHQGQAGAGRKAKSSTSTGSVSPPPSPETASRRAKMLLHRISRRRQESEDERWVCVEVQHKVTQRVVGVFA